MHDEFENGDEVLYEGAQCCPCELDPDPRTGYYPNDRCLFYCRHQDDIVRWLPPSEDDEVHIEAVREKLRGDVI